MLAVGPVPGLVEVLQISGQHLRNNQSFALSVWIPQVWPAGQAMRLANPESERDHGYCCSECLDFVQTVLVPGSIPLEREQTVAAAAAVAGAAVAVVLAVAGARAVCVFRCVMLAKT